MGSSGGGSSKPPNDATPAGTITGYGKSTPFNPSFNSVLSNGMGWADTGEIDAANASNAQAAAAQPAAAAATGGGTGNMDAFAQQLLDYQKQQKFGRMMMGMGPQGFAQGLQAMRAPAPVASSPSEQLMMQALQQRQMGGGGTSRMQSSRR